MDEFTKCIFYFYLPNKEEVVLKHGNEHRVVNIASLQRGHHWHAGLEPGVASVPGSDVQLCCS